MSVKRFSTVLALAMAGVVVFSTTGARADELQEFEQARNAYEAQNYRLSVQRFEALVGGDVPHLESRPLILESRKYLAASYLFANRRADAEHQFELLLQEDGSYEVDPVMFPTEVLDVFAAVKARMRDTIANAQRAREEEEARRQREQNEAQAREAERHRLLLDLAQTEVIEHQNSRWIAFVPFGVGQFQNGHNGLGWALAISEGLLGALSITSYLLWASLIGEKPAEADLDRAELAERAFRISNWVTTGLFAALAITGVIDAQVRFVPSIREQRRRPLPDALRPNTVGFGGAPLFSF